nr:MAG TPA: hypothetical protein [Caudoviricetes sp.]
MNRTAIIVVERSNHSDTLINRCYMYLTKR